MLIVCVLIAKSHLSWSPSDVYKSPVCPQLFPNPKHLTKQSNQTVNKISFYETQSRKQEMHPTIFTASAVDDKRGPVVYGDSGPGTSCNSPLKIKF